MEEIPLCTLTVLYENIEYIITTLTNSTVKDLQGDIYKSTGVEIAKQNLYENDMLNEKGIDKTVGDLGLGDGTILCLTEKPDVPKPVGRLLLEQQTSYYEYYHQLLPLGPYINNFRDGIAFRQYPRPEKGFLILDERTICDPSLFNSPNGEIYSRPHLLRFLKKVHKICDIAVWSTGSLHDLFQKLLKLDLLQRNDFDFVCLAGEENLTTVRIPHVGVVKTKNLRKLWEIYRDHRKYRTVICDVDANNYYLNQRNGLLVSPYRYQPGQQDDELLQLKRYLKHITERFWRFGERDHQEWHTLPIPNCEWPRCPFL